MTWLQRIFRRRNMTPISRRLRFDANLFDSRVPPESRFLSRFESDYPFFIQDNLLPTETCDRIVRDLLAGGSRGKLAVKPNGAETSLLDRKMRDTDFLPLPPEHLKTYLEAVEKIRPEIDRFFKIRLGKNEGVQGLGYPVGGRYGLHADNCTPILGPKGRLERWDCLFPRRIISTLCFLTNAVDTISGENQCSGGDLTFDYLLDENDRPFRLRSKKGSFLAFPGTPYFSHQIHPVTAGYRVTLVDWYAAEFERN